VAGVHGLKKDFSLIHRPIDDLSYPAGAYLYRQGSQGINLFTLRSGLVKLVQYLSDGTQRIVRLLHPGTIAGLDSLVDHFKSLEHIFIEGAEIASHGDPAHACHFRSVVRVFHARRHR